MVATAGVSDDHATDPVRFCVLPSLNVPVAVNCCVAFLASVGFAGVTAIDLNVAPATVRVIEPTTLPDVAVMSVLPADFAVTIPLPLIVATLGLCEFHATLAEISGADPSEKCPTAVNCCEVPTARVALIGETSMDVNRAWFCGALPAQLDSAATTATIKDNLTNCERTKPLSDMATRLPKIT
jgi:hypothetical protein